MGEDTQIETMKSKLVERLSSYEAGPWEEIDGGTVVINISTAFVNPLKLISLHCYLIVIEPTTCEAGHLNFGARVLTHPVGLILPAA